MAQYRYRLDKVKQENLWLPAFIGSIFQPDMAYVLVCSLFLYPKIRAIASSDKALVYTEPDVVTNQVVSGSKFLGIKPNEKVPLDVLIKCGEMVYRNRKNGGASDPGHLFGVVP